MNVFIQLRDDDKKLFFLKSYMSSHEVKKIDNWTSGIINLVWTDDKKEAHNFKSFDNADFQKLLDMFAEEHHLANITYVTKKR